MAQAKTPTIVFVCTGNSCRSPMAERLVAHALAAENSPLADLQVTSAGLSAASGRPASENAHLALRKVGLSLEGFRSKSLDQELLDRALAVFCMTESHRDLIHLYFEAENTPVFLVREFLDDPEKEIPDPFGADIRAYEAARDSIVEAVPSIIQQLKKLLNGG